MFKPKNLGEARQDKETAVEKCELKFRNSVAGDGQCRLIIQLHCKHGILKTYQLTYEDEQSMHAVFDPRKCQNRWVISAKLLKDYMDHFIAKTEELAMSAAQSKLILTAFTEGLTYNTGRGNSKTTLLIMQETLKQAVHTVISLDTSEFQTYDISRELSAEIVFSLRDFKSIITLAESFSVDVQTGYGQPGHPLIITFQIGGMDAQFMIATISENGSTQPSTIQTANTTNTTHLPPSSSASGPKRRRRVNGSSSQRPSSTHPPPPSLERQASLTSAINSIPIRDNNGYGDNDDLGQIEWDTRQSGDDANHDSSVGHQPPVPDADIVYINPNEEGEELLPTQHRTQVRGLFDRDL